MGNGPSSVGSASNARRMSSATPAPSSSLSSQLSSSSIPTPPKKKHVSGSHAPSANPATVSPAHCWNTVLGGSHSGHSAFSQMMETIQGDNQHLCMRSSSLGDRPGDGISAVKLPTVFKWTGAGKEVFISGSFNGWAAKIPLVRSQENFYTILELPEGKHEYKFIVDGQWLSDAGQPTVGNDQGSCNNVLEVKSTDFEVFEALAMDLADSGGSPNHAGGGGDLDRERHRSSSPSGQYTRELPVYSRGGDAASANTTGAGKMLPQFTARRSAPPTLPPHLLQAILNRETASHCDPNLLPPPAHVMLNHLYALSIKDGVLVLSSCFRYRKKYVSTILYKPT